MLNKIIIKILFWLKYFVYFIGIICFDFGFGIMGMFFSDRIFFVILFIEIVVIFVVVIDVKFFMDIFFGFKV